MGSTSQHRFPLEQFCSHRTKSPLARKSFVLAGQNLFFRKKSFVLPDKIFSGQKRSCSEERRRKLAQLNLFSSERVSFGTDVTFSGSKNLFAIGKTPFGTNEVPFRQTKFRF